MKPISPTIKPTRKIAAKILELLSHGLVSGVGQPIPGQMCVEAAVCFAMGLPHGDEPQCVGRAVRDFKIKLNDCEWPSNQDRAEGMKGLAIAQLGSDTLDQMEFGKLMFLRGTQKILSFVWRKESEQLAPDKKIEMIGLAERMEKVTTFEEAKQIAKDAYAYAYAYAYASAYAAAAAAAYASAYAAAASASAAAYASAAYASAYASTYASTSASKHELLKLTAQVGLDVLIEMKSPGCKWLSLIE